MSVVLTVVLLIAICCGAGYLWKQISIREKEQNPADGTQVDVDFFMVTPTNTPVPETTEELQVTTDEPETTEEPQVTTDEPETTTPAIEDNAIETTILPLGVDETEYQKLSWVLQEFLPENVYAGIVLNNGNSREVIEMVAAGDSSLEAFLLNISEEDDLRGAYLVCRNTPEGFTEFLDIRLDFRMDDGPHRLIFTANGMDGFIIWPLDKLMGGGYDVTLQALCISDENVTTKKIITTDLRGAFQVMADTSEHRDVLDAKVFLHAESEDLNGWYMVNEQGEEIHDFYCNTALILDLRSINDNAVKSLVADANCCLTINSDSALPIVLRSNGEIDFPVIVNAPNAELICEGWTNVN